ncbi:hypothetical protein DAEQUDRAFT_271745 [Daedalea quercina L-15889]|uniref:Uncharacterized protein n=1 Tax=Daedalea quercina L-15889 TaxID=1314783 RepID=A0A165QCT6_9APHY|nr:hypothetical protein DAEQUDRAFT_271745 [Daedalea quercina L-15889]
MTCLSNYLLPQISMRVALHACLKLVHVTFATFQGCPWVGAYLYHAYPWCVTRRDVDVMFSRSPSVRSRRRSSCPQMPCHPPVASSRRLTYLLSSPVVSRGPRSAILLLRTASLQTSRYRTKRRRSRR